MEIFKKNILNIALIVGLFLAIRPLFSSGFFPMHDDTQPARVFEMAKALDEGQFPVRWVSDLGYGYGYPIFNFYSPLPYYVGAIPLIFGIDTLMATKAMFAIGMILAGIGMYLTANKLWGSRGATVSALLYVLAPYHAVQLYVRGAIGELWAYALVPFVFWGILEAKSHSKKGFLIGAVGLAGVILSHNISALILFFLLFLWIFWELGKSVINHKISNYLLPLVNIILVGLGLSSFFFLPALFESQYTKVEQLSQSTNDFHQHFVYIDQLWDSPWGYGGSAQGRADGLSFKIGKIHLLLALLSLVWYLTKKNIFNFVGYEFLIFFVGGVISIVMILPVSLKLWEFLPYFSFIQYPWRFLTFALFFISLISGAFYIVIQKSKYLIQIFMLLPVLLLILMLNTKYFQPQLLDSRTSVDYTSEEALKWTISKISDEYLPKTFLSPLQKANIAHGKIDSQSAIMIKSVDAVSNRITTKISASNQAEIVFNVAYFPGWELVVDSQKIKPIIKDGKMAISLLPGNHTVTAYFANTPIRTIGNIISAISFIVLVSIWLKIRYEKN